MTRVAREYPVGDHVEARYVVRLEPMTPVHVWSGHEAYTGLDLVIEGDHACIVDFERLPEDIVMELAAAEPRDYARLFAKHAGRLPCKVRFRVCSKPSPGTAVKLLASSVLPGSSLKGYLRTAVLYHMLSGMDASEARRLLRSAVNLENIKRASEGLEAAFFRAPRARRQGGFVDAFQSLLVSDPRAENLELCLRELTVYKLAGLEKVASVHAVTLDKGVLEYDILVTKPVNLDRVSNPAPEFKTIISTLSRLGSVDMLEALKRFGCDMLEHEYNRVRGVKGLEDYVSLLERLRRELCKPEGSCAPARIGFMTGYQFKTVLKLVQRLDPQLYNEIVSTLSQHYGRIWDELTVKLVHVDGKLFGVGWCRVCVT